MRIEVRDPAKAWRTGALAKLGCSPPRMSVIEWAIGPGSGPTADAALADLVARTGKPTTWLAAQEGYVAAREQTYLMLREGKPWVSAEVTRDRQNAYTAHLGTLCAEGT